MPAGKESNKSGRTERSDTLTYLERRVREEANAAVTASSVEATLIHVLLATGYARRLGECSGRSGSLTKNSWVEEHRLW